MDEYAEQDPTVFTQVVRPALSDREGWAIFITTPKGANHAYDMYRFAKKEGGEWFTCVFKASETGIIPQKELEAARAVMSPEEYDQEYECSFTAALVGAYYKEEMARAQKEKRITRVPYDNHVRVITAWDLGMDDSTAIWFIQECGRELHAIDYLEVNSKGLPEIIKLIREKPYDYAEHLLPHDAAARELGTGKSRVEIIKKLGLKNVRIAPKLKREDGIAAVRSILGKMWFDEHNCGYGIEALKAYERVFDTKDNVFKTVPKHNWASHCADALRTFATGYRLEEDKTPASNLVDRAETDYDIFGV
jgi:phage terminase large subunit